MHSSHHEGRSGQAADASVSSSLRVKAEPVRGGAETNEKYAVRGAEAADQPTSSRAAGRQVTRSAYGFAYGMPVRRHLAQPCGV